jgi:hypothetical protein
MRTTPSKTPASSEKAVAANKKNNHSEVGKIWINYDLDRNRTLE